MGILYRAVWASEQAADVDQHFDGLRTCIAAWAQESTEPESLVAGRRELVLPQGKQRVVAYRSIDSHNAFEVVVTDTTQGDATEWTTVIRVVADDGRSHVLVENSMDSDDLTLRVSVGRPRVVNELLRAVPTPMLRGSKLLTEPVTLPANAIGLLSEILADPDRTLPMIVCSEPGGEHDDTWLATAGKIATRAEGVANVVTLDHAAVTAFKNQYDSLAIWGGGIRVYVPGVPVAESDAWRHRYYLRSRLETARQSTIDRIVYAVAQLSARRRVPEVFRVFGEQSGLPADALDGMIPASELQEARDQWEFELEVALDERSELEKELSRASGHLARLKDELIAQGLSHLIWGTQHADDTSIPDEVQDTSDAVLAAQLYLTDWLVVPDSALRELDDIDTAPTAFAWGNNTWRGLRALAAYAQDRANGWDKGGFWDWCKSGPLLGWPATSKKLSMSEGETVQNNERLRRARVFQVDRAVDASGKILMLAHLKISEGGGPLAPRVYFHDDTGGSTGKVYVGLVGPHSLVPNKSTN